MSPEELTRKINQLEEELRTYKKKVDDLYSDAGMPESVLKGLTRSGFMKATSAILNNGATGREYKSLFVEHGFVPSVVGSTNKSLIGADYVEYYLPFTANPATDVCTSQGHGFSNGNQVILRTTSVLPAPLSSAVTFYIINATTDTFKLEASLGGGAVNITNIGTGVHYIARL
jgi:hypothetical protein